LNACFPRDAPTPNLESLRSIDSKAFDEVALDTRQLASRQVGFEVFGMNIRTDLLRAVVGVPADPPAWGSRVMGRDSFAFSTLPGASLRRVARDLLRLWHAADYKQHFPWVDNIKPVRDEELTTALEEAAARAVQLRRLDLVGPEELDLGRVCYYRISGDVRANQRLALDLQGYVNRVGRENVTIEKLRHDMITSFDDDGRAVDRKSVFECLVGDLTLDRHTYVIADGEFYAVDRDFLRALDRDITQIPIHDGLPDGQLGEQEDAYNARASQSPDLILLDMRTIRLENRTTPVEPCDLFSRTGAFIHVKRHVRSSTLSHLFSQGAVAGELLITSETFRTELRDVIGEVEAERQLADPEFQRGMADLISVEAPSRFAHEVVFAIIASWGDRPVTAVLPFFSKLNLRQRADELNRLGLKVAVARVGDR
jgi:uncharacterized protein (TIGR04141 family)